MKVFLSDDLYFFFKEVFSIVFVEGEEGRVGEGNLKKVEKNILYWYVCFFFFSREGKLGFLSILFVVIGFGILI